MPKINRRLAISVIFWVATPSIFFSLAFYFLFQSKLENELRGGGWNSGWTITVADEKQTLDFKNIELPTDLRRHIELKKYRHWIFKRDLLPEDFEGLNRPAVVLGRIGDSDKVRLGGCFVGSTGLTQDNKSNGWWWGVLRIYEIPQACFKTNLSKSQTLEIEVFKWGGPSYGIYGGPLGLGEYLTISRLGQILEFFRHGVLAIFGFLLLWGVGVYYLFVHVLVSERKYNGVFGLSAMSVGIYLIVTSTILYRYISNSAGVMKLNFVSAALSSFLILGFLRVRFQTISKLLIYIIGLGGAVGILFALQKDNLAEVYIIYEKWFLFFLISYFVAYFQFIYSWLKRRQSEMWWYVVGYSLFIVSCVHDIRITFLGIDRPYLISYGFISILVAASMALAKEYADAFTHVEEQVGERTKDLAGALDQLRSLEKMKERFFSNISHDFKTPITVALGSIEEVKKGAGGDHPSASVLSRLAPAERSMHQLLGMIKDLLDTVKAESGTLKMTWELAKPADLLREWIQPYEVLCRKKGIALELDFSGLGALKIPMDVSKLHRVIDNLLSNAVKFTDRRKDPERRNGDIGAVRVNLRTDSARVYFEISDSGMGVPEEERTRIFERFFQSSRTSLKEHGGSGIGLSFAKEMVEIHNGKIWVETSEFGGSKFVVALPLSQDVEVTGEHEVAPMESDEVLRGSLDVAYPSERPKKIHAGWPTILVAEDNPEVAQIEATALSDEFNVHFAPNGLKAFERLQKEAFDCLVTDIVMPQMRGDELVKRVREERSLQGLPIVVVSAQGEDLQVAEVLRLGANDYVTKPFKREILLARVRAQVEARKTTDWIAKNEKVIELGYLAGGMAHQIRNGLNSLHNQLGAQAQITEDLLDEVKELPEATRDAARKRLAHSQEITERALQRIENLTESIRVYSTGSTQLADISAADSVQVALTIHNEAIKLRSVKVETTGLETLKFSGYAAFHEVMVNLLGNAIQACKDDGTGVVQVVGRDAGDMIEVSIQDNGMGISPEVLPKLCRPFFTTKPPGEGTGLGLYMVRDIVEGQHNGKLFIPSPGPDRGATFTVQVPKVARESKGDSEVIIHGVTVS